MSDATTRAARLRDLLGQPGPLVVPGCFDAFTGLLVERAGFDAAFVSGAGVAYTRLGRPDVGLVSLGELAASVAPIADRVAIPLIVDIDTGFGNALNVKRTVRTMERAGASAMQLEDQAFPKRCGHLTGKSVVPVQEMLGKLAAALDARDDALIVARTDAIAVEGFDAAMDRAEAYVEAGADVLFVEAPRSRDELVAIGERFGARLPVLANMVEGGSTPISNAAELGAMGFRVVLVPGAIARAFAHAGEALLATLKRDGATAAFAERMVDVMELNRMLGLEPLLEDGARYDPAPSRRAAE
ncbi:isocitrate lyase/PEP mutase family protein [Acuticoccus sp.]|uniref:isocitrate lyase/PEP mutase family protein n=1 Tax=Acuticoccus sp. TaxID=1904378 RepID=UPI003B520E29